MTSDGPDAAPAGLAIVAVYGTLRHGGRLHHHMGTATHRSVAVGRARIVGDIYEVAPWHHAADVDTSYPCLHLGSTGRVVVDLFEVRDPTLWADLDELEGYDPTRLDDCEYHRRRVPLLEVAPADLGITEAWTYVYVRAAPDPERHVAGGDWIASRD